MTKEEIQKNSEHWYNKYKELEQKLADLEEINAILSESSAINQKDLEYKVSVIKQRNKRIEELEKENANLKSIAEFQQSSNMKRYFEIQDLEKKNEELKSRNCWKTCEYAEPKSELIAQHIKDVQHLTKAKDLLLRFIELKNKPCASGHSVNMLLYENICVEVEQFIKEN